MSRLCFGTMTIGSSAWKPWVLDEAASRPLLGKCLDLGITFFDTANWYSTGESERIVASTLTSMVPRDSLVLATKAFYAMSDDPNDRGLSRKHLLASVDASLARMRTDYIDLLVIHAFDPETPIEETMAALHDIVRAGKVRYLGASTMFAWQFVQMNHVARVNGWTPFVNMQCQYNLLYREEEREMLPYCRHQGIAVTAFSVLARGCSRRATGFGRGPMPISASCTAMRWIARSAPALRRSPASTARPWRPSQSRGSCPKTTSAARSSAPARWTR